MRMNQLLISQLKATAVGLGADASLSQRSANDSQEALYWLQQIAIQAPLISGGTSSADIAVWEAATAYLKDVPVRVGALTMIRTAAGTSGASFTVGEAAAWTLISQTVVPDWSSTTVYMAGQKVLQNGVLYISATTRTSGATFDDTEEGNWVDLATNGHTYAWTASTEYGAGATAMFGDRLIRRIAAGTSEPTFDLTEAGTWNLVSQPTVSAWAASAVYMQGERVILNGVEYTSASTRTSTATFDTAEEAFWADLANKAHVSAWTATTHYHAGALATRGDTVIERVSAGDSAATFSLVEAAAWSLSAQVAPSAWVASTVYLTGQEVKYNGASYVSLSTRTSGASFDVVEAAFWSADTSGAVVPDWVAATYYDADAVVNYFGKLIRRNAAGESEATFSLIEAGTWDLIAQTNTNVPFFPGIFLAGQAVTISGVVYRSATTRTAGFTFDAAEAANWAAQGMQAHASAWNGSTHYEANALVSIRNGAVILRALADLDSEATFDITEAAKWGVWGQGITDWAASTVYVSGEQVRFNGVVYDSLSTRTSTASFNLAESLFWSYNRTTHFGHIWSATAYYTTQEEVSIGTKVIRRISDGDAEATFNETEAALWTIVSQTPTDWVAATVYMAGELVRASSILWERTAVGTSGLSFDNTERALWTKVRDIIPAGSVEGHVPAYSVGDARYTAATTPGVYVAPAQADLTAWTSTLDSVLASGTFDFRNETEYNLTDSGVAVGQADSVAYSSLHTANTDRVYEFCVTKAVGTVGVVGQLLLQDDTVLTDFVAIDFDPNAVAASSAFQATAGGNATVSVLARDDTGDHFRILVSVLRPSSSTGVWTASIKAARSATLGGVDDGALNSTVRVSALRIDRHNVTSGQRHHLLQVTDLVGEVGGGLSKRGIFSADGDVGEGIYGFDASGAAFPWTLPPATGSQERRVFHCNDVAANNVTIGVAAGESLNAVTDKTFTCSIDDEVLLAVDVSAGKWTVQVVGAGASTDLDRYSIMGVIDNLNVVSGVSVIDLSTLQASDADDGAVIPLEELDAALLRSVSTITIEKTGEYLISSEMAHPALPLVGGNAQSTGGINRYGLKINGADVWYSENSDSGLGDIFTYSKVRPFSAGDTLQLIYNASSSVTAEDFHVSFNLVQLPTSEVVLAGMVEPTPLHVASLATSIGSFTGVDDPVIFDETLDDTGGMVTSSTVITIVQDGKYEISANATADLDEAASTLDRFVHVCKNDPAPVDDAAASAAEILVDVASAGPTTFGLASFNMQGVFDLVAGDTIILYFHALAGTDRVRRADLTVRQLADSTVVNPGLVPVTSLHRARLRDASGGATVAGDNDLTPATADYNVGGIAAAGVVTISQAGTYTLNASAGNVTNSNNSQVYLKVDGVKIARGRDTQVSQGLLDSLSCSATVDLAIGQTVQMGVYTAGADTTATALEDQPTLEVVQLTTLSVIRPEDTLVDDQAASGYIDIGTVRMAWGTTAGASNVEAVTFPGGGFAATPVLTFAPVSGTLREIAVNSITSTTASLETGAALVKMWQAKGFKP